MKESRTPKAVNAAWDIIVKSMKALSDEDRDVPLAQDLTPIGWPEGFSASTEI